MKITEAQLRARYKKWTDALRSGKYEQGRRRLKNGSKYCCLGVLVDLGDSVIRKKNGWYLPTTCGTVRGIDWRPPVTVTWALGLSDWDIEDLIRLNDDEKRSFSYIAEYIENLILPNSIRRVK